MNIKDYDVMVYEHVKNGVSDNLIFIVTHNQSCRLTLIMDIMKKIQVIKLSKVQIHIKVYVGQVGNVLYFVESTVVFVLDVFRRVVLFMVISTVLKEKPLVLIHKVVNLVIGFIGGNL